MEPITIHLKDQRGFARHGEAVQLGLPFAEGDLEHGDPINLHDPGHGRVIPCQTTPMAHWPNGSVRWLKLNFLVDVAPHQSKSLHLHHGRANDANEDSPLKHQATEKELLIETGKVTFRLPRNQLEWIASTGPETELRHEIRFNDQLDTPCTPEPDSGWQVTESGPVSITLNTRGQWLTTNDEALARFDCSLRFYANSETAEIEVCLHNPKRAHHPGGLWDLGDPGSVQFRALTIHVQNPGSNSAWLKTGPDNLPLTGTVTEGLDLYQDSSGGDQWQSRNHVNADGEITTRFRGYQVYSREKSRTAGDRANPIAALEGPNQTVQASMRQFWQNFPSFLGTKHQELIIGLFPAEASGPYELQGGERKTQTAYLNYGSNPDALNWTQSPLVPILDAELFERTEAFPWFKANASNGPLDNLIQEGLDGPNNFFAKREVIDEFGWRNFGDLFADHETLYQKEGEEPLISHYNNQYDAVYGFARQFALTGDPRWFELMDDLARHVTDIDIYHTKEDRAEYNNGLFWHTDHYLDAHTASHRTFTKHNNTSSTAGQTGGGPGAEHCYTTGLLYHYLLTGQQQSRDSVLEMANWMKTAQEGQGGLLEQVLAVKKHDLPQLMALLKGQQPSAHRYPFTRATGNYLNSLLDAWHLEPGKNWLNLAERVIHETIHPADNIEQRNLLNIEENWSYLVLLSSIARYLSVKQTLSENDEAYEYAKEAFLNYARWMLNNERPFLSDPSQLVYANHTWVAQDVRKAMLMFQTAGYRLGVTEGFLEKGTQWLIDVCEDLRKNEERHFTRILVILMQNYGPQYLQELEPPAEAAPEKNEPYWRDQPQLTLRQLAARITLRLIRGIAGFRPAQEKAWLAARLDRS
ncbi:RIFT barrel domain-containing protein [Marinobacter zhanjiangensis]|uniref:PcRGLX/YetA-like N-terminal RIFT barrel domain-containing protein n=1 Tax=Marinobacter zhanjiangensis TaxID=578215 RepID=A0ABQ3B9I7_9GAMM|nr:hypothetical protein [Marinobacter zhanjiangensis]GGY80246.1 hypothetical protein GCM10007071_29460 [Marinobacter zhanjiangensis]